MNNKTMISKDALFEVLDAMHSLVVGELNRGNVAHTLTEEQRGELFEKGKDAIEDKGIKLNISSRDHRHHELIMLAVAEMKKARSGWMSEIPDFPEEQYQEIVRLSEIFGWYRTCVQQFGSIH